MKNLIVICLLAAIGAVLVIEKADAQAMGFVKAIVLTY